MFRPSASSTNRPTLASSSLVSLPRKNGSTTIASVAVPSSATFTLVRRAGGNAWTRVRSSALRPAMVSAAATARAASTGALISVSPPRGAYTRSASTPRPKPCSRSVKKLSSSDAAPSVRATAIRTRRCCADAKWSAPPAAPNTAPSASHSSMASGEAKPHVSRSEVCGLQFTSGSRRSNAPNRAIKAQSPTALAAPVAVPAAASRQSRRRRAMPSSTTSRPATYADASGTASSDRYPRLSTGSMSVRASSPTGKPASAMNASASAPSAAHRS